MSFSAKRYTEPSAGGFIQTKTAYSDMSAAEREEIKYTLTVALNRMRKGIDVNLIPYDGCFMVYAMSHARGSEDVAGIQGSIVQEGTGAESATVIAYNADNFLTLTVLTVMKFYPHMRSAACFWCSEKIVETIEEMMFDIRYAKKVDSSSVISLLDFEVASFCSIGDVPDIIINTGEGKKERILRLLGENPDEVVTSLIKIAARINNTTIEDR